MTKLHTKTSASATYFWEGSWAKNFLAFSYEIGFSPSIKSDKSISKVGPRLLNSEPNDTWNGCEIDQLKGSIEMIHFYFQNSE